MRFPGLTPQESRLVAFLVVAFSIGCAVKAWRAGTHPVEPPRVPALPGPVAPGLAPDTDADD